MRRIGIALLVAGSVLAQKAPKQRVELVYRLDLESVKTEEREAVLEETIAIVKERINRYLIPSAVVRPAGADRFTVRLVSKPEQLASIKRLIASPGTLELRITVEKDADNFAHYFELFQRRKRAAKKDARLLEPADLEEADRKRYALGLRWHRVADAGDIAAKRAARDADGTRWMLVTLDPYDITSADFENVFAARDASSALGDTWCVYFDVKKAAQEKMAKLTRWRDNCYLAVILNGQVQTAPILRCTISKSGQVTGKYTPAEAHELAAILGAGTLEHVPQPVSERVVER